MEVYVDLQTHSQKLAVTVLVRVASIAMLATACFGCGGRGGATESVPASVAFTSIGPLPDDISSQATAVSADGTVVAGTSKSVSGKSQAFRWSAADGLKGLGFMTVGTSSSAKAVSADGTMIVGDGDAAGASFAVFRWNASAGLIQLKALADSKLCVAGGVSGNGNVIVGTCVTANNSAFRWTESTGMVALGQFGTGSNRTSNALAVSGDASTIVGMGHPVLTGAVMWNSIGESTILGFLPGDTSAVATAASRDGSVVVGHSTQPSSHPRAFRWTRQSGMAAIASSTDPSLSDVVATAISGDGLVTVGWGVTSKGETALLWDELHGMRRIEDLLKADYGATITGWVLSRANNISDDGRTVVGVGVNPKGNVEGWVLKFPN